MINGLIKASRLLRYKLGGMKPWTAGYNEFRWNRITESIHNEKLIEEIRNQKLPEGFGLRLDDRVVEYPWIFSNLSKDKKRMLDAGSTFNFPEIVNHPTIKQKDLSIFTFYPEKYNFANHRISYQYGDLRDLPYKDNLFDEVVSQSTIEHIDMDNSMYGYDLQRKDTEQVKSYSYMEAVKELYRVTKDGGMLMITFPYGKFENHGFYQQFDGEMIERVSLELKNKGNYSETYFLYKIDGWHFSTAEESSSAESFNPQSGIGKGNDGAAHCRSICCIKLIKK